MHVSFADPLGGGDEKMPFQSCEFKLRAPFSCNSGTTHVLHNDHALSLADALDWRKDTVRAAGYD